MQIKDLLHLAVAADASDLHLTNGMPPLLRVDGTIRELAGFGRLTDGALKGMIYDVLSRRQIKKFEEALELDCSVYYDERRFRVNVHRQRGSVEAAFRVIPSQIKTLNRLGMPASVAELAGKRSGLVMVTGPAGVGKTTTLASMIELINTERSAVIITIEDPIEYLFTNKNCVIKQREVGTDTNSFAAALKSALRQDPNVIMVGEMRDLETISTAITAAETGHLVLSTLHTPDAPQSIDRLIDVFPEGKQAEVRTQLANCLQGIISQQLLPRSDGRGRIAAVEVLMGTPGTRHLIKERQTQQLSHFIQTGASCGMKTMDASIKQLYNGRLISRKIALSAVKDIEEFCRL